MNLFSSPHSPRRSFAKSPFTLIELLIVIAVIAILAGMLLPALDKTKQISKTISCMNNTKTIMSGMVLYSDTYQFYPPRHISPNGSYVDTYWFLLAASLLNPNANPADTIGKPMSAFYKLYPFYKCPAYRLSESVVCNYALMPYGKNNYIGGAFTLATGIEKPLKPEQVKRPSMVVAVGDSDDDGYYGYILSGANYSLGNRHSGSKGNAAFCDGHAETVLTRDYMYPGQTLGTMDFTTGATITKTSGISGTAYPLELRYKWGVIGGGYDYMTK